MIHLIKEMLANIGNETNSKLVVNQPSNLVEFPGVESLRSSQLLKVLRRPMGSQGDRVKVKTCLICSY